MYAIISRSDLDSDNVLNMHAFPNEESLASSWLVFSVWLFRRNGGLQDMLEVTKADGMVEIKIKTTNLKLCIVRV
jgi:hypothetical protein